MNPAAPLTLDSTGNLYGTTPSGGTGGGDNCCGVVFELSPGTGGWTETVLFDFCGSCLQGGTPSSGVIFDRAGNLYGATSAGYYGNQSGTIFELSPGSGGQWTETALYSFCNSYQYCAGGYLPRGQLTLDSAGNLYGTALAGGVKKDGGGGVVFELSHQPGGSWSENVLFAFDGGREGWAPSGGVVFDAAGNLYGTTLGQGQGGSNCSQGSDFGCGVVFELSPSGTGWTETIVHNFRGTDGIGPSTGVTVDASGTVYGTAAFSGFAPHFNGGGSIFKLSPSSGEWQESFRVLSATDGVSPSSLISDGKGNLFGTTGGGGVYGFGTVFELSPNSRGGVRRTILYSFKDGSDGSSPESLTFDAAGNLYGVTFEGGIDDWGTVFELSPGTGGSWNERILHAFDPNTADGLYPVGSVVFDAAGNMYGVTWEGGTTCCGTVFELTPSPDGSWTETILHNFVGGNGDGWNPLAGVALDSAGNLYGTTGAGGSTDNGTVYKLSPNGDGIWTETLLYAFGGGSDGSYPAAAPVLDGHGNLFATASLGGNKECFQGCGAVIELSSSNSGPWPRNVIDMLDRTVANPGGLVFDTSGNLYIASTQGNLSNCSPSCGAIFKLDPQIGGNWKQDIVFSFSGSLSGSYPQGPVVFDTAGNIYGPASRGGSSNEGLVFQLTGK